MKFWHIETKEWLEVCILMFIGQGIDLWHCQKPPTSRVAKSHTAGLPDYEILAYFAKLKPSKGLEICIHMFFWNGELTGDIFGSLRRAGLPDFALQGCRLWNLSYTLFFIRIMILSGWESFGPFLTRITWESFFFKIRIIGQNKHHCLSNYNNSS